MTDKNQLRRILSDGCDRSLTGSEQLTISALLANDSESVREYVQYVATESLVEQSCGLTFRDSEDASCLLPGATTIRGDGKAAASRKKSGSPSKQASPTSNIQTSWLGRIAIHPLWAVAALLLISLTVGLAWFTKSPLATIVAANEAQLADGRELRVGQALGDRWIDLERGSIRLALRDGAMASLEAPSRFRILNGNAAELDRGAVSCQVPESAHNFLLASRCGNIVDLGTGFRAVSTAGGSLSVHVTRGAVRIDLLSGVSLQLKAGQLAEIKSSGQASLLSNSRRMPTVSGQFRFRQEHPESLGYNAFVHDDMAHVFLESHSVCLPYDLRLDVAGTGSYTSFLGSERVIPEGTVVDCYLIHCAPRRARHEVIGTVTFPGKVLGLLANADRLNATNELLGAHWTLACQYPERGVESLPDENSDLIKISRDRRTLSGHFRTMSIDQIRVLVARE